MTRRRNAAIVVEQSFCWCTACGKRVVTEQERHDDIAGDWRLIDPGEVEGGGCGAKFAAITSGTAFYTKEDLSEIRDDLPAVPFDILYIN